MKIENFFSELKRRNVYKIAVAYLVACWALARFSQLLPMFDVPIWVGAPRRAALILGFPVALIFSWAFEITSEGIKLRIRSSSLTNRSRARPDARS